MTFNELKRINNNRLEMYKKEYKSSNNIDIYKQILIYEKIKELFEDNPAIFFKISMEESLKILSKLVLEKNLKETYTELIDPKKYKELRKNFDL